MPRQRGSYRRAEVASVVHDEHEDQMFGRRVFSKLGRRRPVLQPTNVPRRRSSRLGLQRRGATSRRAARCGVHASSGVNRAVHLGRVRADCTCNLAQYAAASQTNPGNGMVPTGSLVEETRSALVQSTVWQGLVRRGYQNTLFTNFPYARLGLRPGRRANQRRGTGMRRAANARSRRCGDGDWLEEALIGRDAFCPRYLCTLSDMGYQAFSFHQSL